MYPQIKRYALPTRRAYAKEIAFLLGKQTSAGNTSKIMCSVKEKDTETFPYEPELTHIFQRL